MTQGSLAVRVPHLLVITRDAWEAAMRPLLADRGGFAVGRAWWLATERDRRMLVERVEVVRQHPAGDRFPPLADWCAFRVAGSGLSAEGFLARLKPKASQTVAAVIVYSGDADDRQPGWDGAVYLGSDHVVPLAGLQIVGPGMLHVERDPTDGSLVENGDFGAQAEQRLRYSRLAGAVGQQVAGRLRNARVTLIGAGRNGSALAFQMASLGVRRLRLVDGDTLALENLDAMPGLTLADVGRPKVTALAKRLLLLRPDLALTCFAASLTDRQTTAALHRLPADLIVTAVDSDTPRMAASLLARETLTVHLDLGTSVTRDESGQRQLAGDVRLLVPGAGCVSCVGGLADRKETLYELLAPSGALCRGRAPAWHEQRAGSLVSLNSIAVGAAVQLWLDLISGRVESSYWQRLRWEPGQGLEVDSGPVSAAEDCPVCRPR